MDVSSAIQAHIKGQNRVLKEELDLKHSRKDMKLFSLRKAVYLEEDVFQYFYPFCVLNTGVLTAVIFRKHSFPSIMVATGLAVEYVYLLFAFPVEAWHFHKRALSTNSRLPYSAYLR